MSLDDIDRVVRERIIGSPPHSLQHLGTLEKVNYIGTIGKVSKLGTIAYLGTVLLTVHVGTVHKVDRIGTLDEMTWAGTLNRIAGGRVGTLGRLGTVHYVERVGTISHLGSIDYIGTVNRLAGGRVGTLGRLGTIHYVQRIGTIQHLGTQKWLGTVRYLGTVNRIGGGRIGTLGRLGTVHYVQRIGTIAHLGSIGRIGTAHTGTVPSNVAAQDIMLGVDLQARYQAQVDFRGSIRQGCGSIWKGSWQVVDRYKTKMLLFQVGNRGTSGGGSIAVIAGMIGTTPYSGTFTLHAHRRIGKGSLGTFSIAEPVQYIRPWVRQHGGPGGSWQPESGGSVSVFLGRHV